MIDTKGWPVDITFRHTNVEYNNTHMIAVEQMPQRELRGTSNLKFRFRTKSIRLNGPFANTTEISIIPVSGHDDIYDVYINHLRMSVYHRLCALIIKKHQSN
ncbi:unnamed protein product [Dicrocoelium dendriticum]|nr:unnamed protein product [Dicrocoelium dendriticum]